MASLKQLASIPSLTQLYRTGKTLASSASNLPPANQTLNDKICTIQYDITKLEVDAVVNAANKRLLGGGGVDGAIHRAAGYELYNECKKLGGCETGVAKITGAYELPCKKVIHAVGPIYSSRAESEPLLRGCYSTSLQLAADNDCKSIAFSAISTGIYGYPSDDAARAALSEVKSFLEGPKGERIEKVIFCNFMQKDVDAYNKIMPEIFPATQEDMEKKVQNACQPDRPSQTKHTANPRSQSSDGISQNPATPPENKVAQSKLETVDEPDKEDDKFGGDVVIADEPITINLVNEASRPPIGTSNIAEMAAPIQPENFEPRADHVAEKNSSSALEDHEGAGLSGETLLVDNTDNPKSIKDAAGTDDSNQQGPQNRVKEDRSPNPAILAAAQKAAQLFKLAQQAEEIGQDREISNTATNVRENCATFLEKVGGDAAVKEVSNGD